MYTSNSNTRVRGSGTFSARSVSLPAPLLPVSGALGNPSPMMFIKTSVLILLATAIGQADARRRMFATQERHSTDNIAKLRDYYGTGSSSTEKDVAGLWWDKVYHTFFTGAQDCPGARGTWYLSTLAFQSTPNRPQASLNAVVTGILSASDCHALGHDMAAAALAGLHANQLTRITTLQDPETALLPTKASVYYGVTQNGKCEIHTLVPGEADLTRGASPFMGFSTCVHA
ncbi:g5306 [Coccomyxa viridis]|uniref:G5306 protein n=1 Tax=Coccomyxa viridis TaxID=1274662 RepID=A0ABP1FSI0_9CHLO